jgi:hypothetical protein
MEEEKKNRRGSLIENFLAGLASVNHSRAVSFLVPEASLLLGYVHLTTAQLHIERSTVIVISPRFHPQTTGMFILSHSQIHTISLRFDL